MNKLTIYLIAALGAVAVFLGGLVIGNVLRDDEPVAAAGRPGVAIAAATPADPDSGPDGPGTVELPRPSANRLPAHLVVPNDGAAADGGVRFGDGQRGRIPEGEVPDDAAGYEADPDDQREPYRPPTVPGGLDEDGSGEPDPDAPYEVADWVEELSVDDLFGPTFDDEPASDEPIFVDPCADPAEDRGDDEPCPEGVGGTILLVDDGAPPDPLSIMRQFYLSMTVPLELRCPDLGTSLDGVYRPLFASNNPADFTIRYWPSTRPDDVREITYRSSDEELERWIAKRIAGDPNYANPHGGVHNCPEFPLQEPFPANGHFTFEIEGVDDFGSRASVTVYDYVPRPEAALGRPPMGFTPKRGSEQAGIVSLRYDPTEEMTYLASIPKTGDRASTETCSDIEGPLLDGRYAVDPSLHRWGTAITARAPGDPEYDPRFSLAATGELWADEGTTYLLCGWVATPARRSFDRPTVVHRDSITVRAPRHLRVRVSVGGGHADEELDRYSVRVRAANWEVGGTGSFPTEPVAARRAFMLDAPVTMFESRGYRVPNQTVIEVEGPSGSTQLLEVPTATRCVDFGFLSVCPEPGASQYDVPIPGRVVSRGMCGSSFGTCDPPTEDTFAGNLRLIVERYAGPGGAPSGDDADDWTVHRGGAFAGADPRERAPLPQIDTNDSYLRSVPDPDGGRPDLLASLRFDRPVRIEVVPWDNNVATCVEPTPQAVEEYRSAHTFRWDDLCFGGAYSLSVLAVDEEGNELDLRTHVDGEYTGYPGWGYEVMPKVLLESFDVDIDIDRLGDGIRPQSLTMSLGGVSAGTLIAPGHPPRCRTDAVPSSTFSRTIATDGGYPIGFGDVMSLRLEVAGTGDGFRCGLDERFVRIQLHQQLSLDELLAAPEHTFVYDEDDAEITVTIRDIVPG